MSRGIQVCMFLLVSTCLYMPAGYSMEAIVSTSEGDDIPVEVVGRSDIVRLLWFPAETGLKAEDKKIAVELAKQGVEVWLVDLFAARFLPLSQSSMDVIPAEDVSRVIRAASSDAARVYIFSPGRGAVPVLRGAYRWQSQQGQLAGIILLHPKLYEETPEPGAPARLLPVVTLTNQPIYLLQPELSPLRWRWSEIMTGLQQGGSDVFGERLKRVRDRFYFRPDANLHEDRLAQQFAQYLLHAMLRLQYVQKLRLLPDGEFVPASGRAGKKSRSLRPYAGQPQPPELQLTQYKGGQRSLAAEQGKVVLVNFWASWCPPCVHEMPSMQALYETYKSQGLEILAVNMAESEIEVESFLHTRIAVQFPILLDQDGEALRRWDVFAFPTSYVIDRKGDIRYALFGAVDWQDATITSRLEQLLEEK